MLFACASRHGPRELEGRCAPAEHMDMVTTMESNAVRHLKSDGIVQLTP